MELMEDPRDPLGLLNPPAKSRTAAPPNDPLGLLSPTPGPARPAPTGHNGVPFVDAGTIDKKGDLAAVMQGLANGIPEAIGALVARHPEAAANVTREIPGADAAAAGARSVVRGQSYRDALADVHGAEDALPAAVRVPTRVAGETLAAAAIPGSAAQAGAAFGAASALGSSNPDEGLKDRAWDAAKQGAVGAVAGKTLDVGLTAARAALSPTLGRQAVDAADAMRAADRGNYQTAADEAAAHYAAGNPTPPAVLAAFAKSDIAPYVAMVRSTRKFANADDATVLQEVYKQLSSEQEGLSAQLEREGYKAKKAIKRDNIGAMKQELLSAADQFMPSFRDAVGEHAGAEGEAEAAQSVTEAARRAIRGGTVSARKLGTQSQEAVLDQVASMKPAEAAAARDAVLATIKENTGSVPNRVTGKNNLRLISPLTRAEPYLRALDDRAAVPLIGNVTDNDLSTALLKGNTAALTPSPDEDRRRADLAMQQLVQSPPIPSTPSGSGQFAPASVARGPVRTPTADSSLVDAEIARRAERRKADAAIQQLVQQAGLARYGIPASMRRP